MSYLKMVDGKWLSLIEWSTSLPIHSLSKAAGESLPTLRICTRLADQRLISCVVQPTRQNPHNHSLYLSRCHHCWSAVTSVILKFDDSHNHKHAAYTEYSSFQIRCGARQVTRPYQHPRLTLTYCRRGCNAVKSCKNQRHHTSTARRPMGAQAQAQP